MIAKRNGWSRRAFAGCKLILTSSAQISAMGATAFRFLLAPVKSKRRVTSPNATGVVRSLLLPPSTVCKSGSAPGVLPLGPVVFHRRMGQCGKGGRTGSLHASTATAAWVLQYLSGAAQFERIGIVSGDFG
jgi:hypothetical protein